MSGCHSKAQKACMTRSADVRSLDALEEFRGALSMFRHEADQALGTIRSELGRFVDWLEHDQLAHWKEQIRRRENRVAEAKNDLHRCLAATIDPHRTPSCYQEKKALDAAQRRLEEAEHKLARVRHWIPIVRQAAFEYCARSEPLASTLASQLPAASAFLNRSVERIMAYQNLAMPAAEIATGELSNQSVEPPSTEMISAVEKIKPSETSPTGERTK